MFTCTKPTVVLDLRSNVAGVQCVYLCVFGNEVSIWDSVYTVYGGCARLQLNSTSSALKGTNTNKIVISEMVLTTDMMQQN